MKKLASKTFLTLFTILSVFLLTVLFIFNYQGFIKEKTSLINNLNRLNENMEPFDKDLMDKNKPDDIENMEKPNMLFDYNKRFIDANIYTVNIDDGKIDEIISHTATGTIDSDIKKVAEDILQNSSKGKTYVGNLYTNRYSYKYYGNSIIISDNLDINNRLVSSLKITIAIFIVGEIVCYVISLVLSKWLIKPAVDSFNKQKEFIADASHELKTPLSVIMASAEAYEKDKDEKWFNNIKSESERMNSLIKNLLNLAKLDNSSYKVEYTSENLSKLCEKSILTLESLMYEKNIKLEYNIAESINFNCNSDEIKELLSILLDNAIKHSTSNGKVIVVLNETNDKITLEIKNKGLPIPKGEEEKIFERFYRVDKARNREENRYGLGLAIAKAIVLRHKGVISASSADDYTTFKVVFKK